jgi:hypothetical protein
MAANDQDPTRRGNGKLMIGRELPSVPSPSCGNHPRICETKPTIQIDADLEAESAIGTVAIEASVPLISGALVHFPEVAGLITKKPSNHWPRMPWTGSVDRLAWDMVGSKFVSHHTRRLNADRTRMLAQGFPAQW